jgi:hypothetical protein
MWIISVHGENPVRRYGVEGEGDGPRVGKAYRGGGGAPEGYSVSDLAPMKEEMGRGGCGA